VGVINHAGEIVVPQQFSLAELSSGSAFWFTNSDGKFGKMSLTGDTIIPTDRLVLHGSSKWLGKLLIKNN
jgi:hypothetical protein